MWGGGGFQVGRRGLGRGGWMGGQGGCERRIEVFVKIHQYKVGGIIKGCYVLEGENTSIPPIIVAIRINIMLSESK